MSPSVADIEKTNVSVLAADAAGYSTLMESDEPRTFVALMQHREVLGKCIVGRRGRIDNTAGDSILAEFASPSEAVECALDFQEGADQDRSGNLLFRIGIHFGEVIRHGQDILGTHVNIAARIQALAAPGGVLISKRVYEKVRDEVVAMYVDLGPANVKNILEPIHIYSVARSHRPGLSRVELAELPSIAVLRFRNMSGDTAQDYLAEGFALEILEGLSQVGTFVVISRASSFLFPGAEAGLARIGAELGVRYILSGSYQRSGKRIRIHGQLDEAERGTNVWADHFDGQADDIFALQDEVTRRVVGALESEVRSAEIVRTSRKKTEIPSAYDSTLKGVSAFYARTEADSELALDSFKYAIEKDPFYALPHAYSAATRILRQAQGWEQISPEFYRNCIEHAERASALGSNDPVALALAGLARAYLGYEPEITTGIVESALSQNPNSAVAWYAYGLVQMTIGNHKDAAAAIYRSIGLNPRDPGRFAYLTSLALAEFMGENYGETIKLADKSLGLHPSYMPALRVKAAAGALAGLNVSAVVRKILEIDPTMSVSKALSQMIRLKPIDISRYNEALLIAGLPK